MKPFSKTLIVTGILAQLATFAAFAEERAGESKTMSCASVSSKSDEKKDQTIVTSGHTTENSSNAAPAK